jgi:hypothetical protein
VDPQLALRRRPDGRSLDATALLLAQHGLDPSSSPACARPWERLPRSWARRGLLRRYRIAVSAAGGFGACALAVRYLARAAGAL